MSETRILILSARSGWHVDELIRAFATRGRLAVERRYESIVGRYGRRRQISAGDLSLLDAPAVVTRIIPDGSLEQLIARVDVLHAVEEAGVPVINSAVAIERTVDKSRTTSLLQRAGLPTPETVVCEDLDTAFDTVRTFGDVVLKPLFGSMGLGMVRLTDEDVAWRVLRAVEKIGGVFYLQQTIDHGGRDVRAFVVGDRVLAAIERRSTGWRTSVARGAEVVAIELDDRQRQLALAAARLVGAEYAGVDLMTSVTGEIYVIEVNGIPGWRGLQQTTNVDVAGEIADHVLTRISETHG